MRLKVIHNAIDLSLKLDNFTNSAFELDLSTSKIYLGFHKPLKNVYFELDARSDDDGLEVEYWNGTTWTALVTEDFTHGLTQSGLVSWSEIDQAKTTHLTYGEMYWIRVTTENLPASVLINGINLVLSNDKDLSFIPNLSDYLPTGTTSFIGFHQEARDQIVQTIRNSGKKILRYNTDETLNYISSRQVDHFDLLEIEEFRNASKYLALHLLFDFLSKSDEDGYRPKADRYYDKHLKSLNTNLISIDDNDNGETDESENQTVQFIRIRRE